MSWMRKNRVLLLAAAVAVLYWLLESLAEYALEGGSISGQLFPADRDEEWLRFVITALILSFGLYAQRAMAANARAEAKYRSIFDNSVDGIFQTTSEGSLVTANPALARMFGYDSPEEIADSVTDVGSQLYAEEVERSELTRLLREEGVVAGYELRGRRRDGGVLWVSVSARAVKAEDGSLLGFEGVIEDVDERKRAEKAAAESRLSERRRIARELHDVVLQDLTDALYSMQLKQLQSRDAGVGLEVEGPVRSVRDSIQALRSVIDDLRAEERHGRSFLELLETMIEAERLKGRGLLVKLEGVDSFPKGISGPAAVEVLRIVQEALVNVRRHSGAACAEVLVEADEDSVRAEVRDDGRGFEPETIPGVGLMAMRERAAALGGELHVTSEPGSGTRVRVAAPRSRFGAESEKRQTVKAESADRGGG